MPIDKPTFKELLSNFASGVTVVTTVHEGKRHGLTVASFASVSIEPPLILVCIGHAGRGHEAIVGAGFFGVSILADDQADVSQRFASSADDKFEGIATRDGSLGAPVVVGAAASMQCRVVAQHVAGDHTIFVGEIEEAESSSRGPLVYHRRGYHTLR